MEEIRSEVKQLGLPATRDWVKASAYGILITLLYFSAFKWLITYDWERADYSFSYLIPFIILYLIWERRYTLFSRPGAISWPGIVPILLGLCFFWLGELSGEFLTLYISFWLVLVGICWLEMGWAKLKILFFPLFLILTTFPLPNFLYQKVSFHLRLASSQLGVAVMRLYGMTAYREGNVIDIGFTKLQVVDACSGLRYLFPLIVLGIILAYLFRASWWKRAVVVLSTIPLSIITNSLRIALTGILYQSWGAEAAEGFFHGFSGWLIFMFSFVVLLGEMKLLGFKFSVIGKKRPSKIRDGDESEGASGGLGGSKGSAPPTSSLQPQTGTSWKGLFHPAQFIVVIILLGGTLALSQGVEFREKVPITRPFSEFPAQVGEWVGTRQTMEQKFINELDLSDYVIMDYRDERGEDVNFYVAYYESQRKGESIHSPETCLPAGGWVFNQAGGANVPMPGTKTGFMPVNRAFIQKGDYRELAYYWFPQRGRILTNAYQLKIYGFWDALTRQRTDGALVRLITPVYENEPLDHADARLQRFAREIVPVLNRFLPGAGSRS
jgi:exosortase D (VPLPA-CTERM-specific)